MKPNLSRGFRIAAVTIGFSLLACSRKNTVHPPPAEQHPAMEYSDLAGQTIRFGEPAISIDVNKDGRRDLLFGVQHVGDPLEQVDKKQFTVVSDIYTNLLINAAGQTIPFQAEEKIELPDFRQSHWYNASAVTLIEKVEHVSGTVDWRGNWVNGSRRYLPFQVLKNNQRFNGWVELSAEAVNGRLVLHRMAISKEPEKEIRAGQ